MQRRGGTILPMPYRVLDTSLTYNRELFPGVVTRGGETRPSVCFPRRLVEHEPLYAGYSYIPFYHFYRHR